ncbi:DNAJ protein [Perkinsela sp. CCAP 1560/4]|nr:DNAJ protein [Perkinsela sp. CCAP 1560/4]|eukprot:KNH08076.1 DNAJ protein [Perkinsela sp. CCAP 1560/4]
MTKHAIALRSLLVLQCALLFHSIPSPDDYTKLGRKWLTFKNIPDGQVVQVDTMYEFRDFMHGGGKLAVLLFYDDRTTHSKQLFPLWEGLAMTLDGVAQVAAVSVSSPFGHISANLYGVDKVPSVHIMSFPTDEDTSYQTADNIIGSHVEEFTDGISIGGINKAVLQRLTDDYIEFPQTSGDFEALRERLAGKRRRHIVILLTRKKKTTDLYKTLSYKFGKDYAFIQVPYSTDLSQELMEKFELSKPKDWGPLLFLYEFQSDSPVILYEGKKFDVPSISAFLDRHVSTDVKAVDAMREGIAEMLQGVKSRCDAFSYVNEGQLRSLLNAQDTFLVAIWKDTADQDKARVMQNMACSYTTSNSIRLIVWTDEAQAEKLKKMLGISLNEGYVALCPSAGVFSYSEAPITHAEASSFQKTAFKETMSFDPKSF